MSSVVVLASDWDSGVDPVPFYSEDPTACLDFDEVRLKPRAVLKRSRADKMRDCNHRVLYDVVVCEVKS
jgi:hypothetical protein